MSKEPKVNSSVFISKKDQNRENEYNKKEFVGKVRHDAKKVTQGIMDLISRMTYENHVMVVDDINRENQLLCQILESYQETHLQFEKDFDLKQILWESTIPYISASPVQCEIQIFLESTFSRVKGNSVSTGRALINIVSNSLDAIKDSGRKGLIRFELKEENKYIVLIITDNGTGIDKKRLEKGPDGLPLFVGISSKEIDLGSGIGTKQIYETFGAENIQVESELGKSTIWKIKISKETSKYKSKHFVGFEKRYLDLIDGNSDTICVSKLRKMEFLLYDLVMQFSRYNNVRDLFTTILHCIYRDQPIDILDVELKECQIDEIEFKQWILQLVQNIQNDTIVFHSENSDSEEMRGELFKSYNQTTNRTIVFLIDPDSGNFMSADRILIEHLDLVPFFDVEKDQLLRGDFIGDLENEKDPITLGLWYVSSRDDLIMKLRSIRSCAVRLIKMGINPEKTIAFYNTVNNQSSFELNTNYKLNLKGLADFPDDELETLIVEEEDEMHGMIFTD